MKRIAVIFKSNRLLLISGIVLSIALLGCESKEPIQIGFIASTSGRMADLGAAGRDAVQLAVDQWNARGGVGGRRVKLLIKNDQQNAEAAVQAVQELIKEEVAAIIGPMTSNMAMAIIPCLNEARIIAVGPTISTQHLSGKDDYFFRVSPANYEFATCCAEYHLKSKGVRKFVVIYDNGNRAYSENWLKNFKKRFVLGGGQITAAIAFEKDENRSFSQIVQTALATDPDGILVIANAMDSALICHQIRKSDPNIKITLADWSATDRLTELGGKAVEGVTVVQAFDRDSSNPLYQAFRKIYRERYRREPGFAGFYAYDAAQVVLTALNARKGGRSLKERVLSMGEFDGLQGKIIFDEYGDVKPSKVSISIIRNRKFVVVE